MRWATSLGCLPHGSPFVISRLQPSSLLIHELGEEFCVSTTNAAGQAQEVGAPLPCPYEPIPPTTLLSYQRIRPGTRGAPRRSCMHVQA